MATPPFNRNAARDLALMASNRSQPSRPPTMQSAGRIGIAAMAATSSGAPRHPTSSSYEKARCTDVSFADCLKFSSSPRTTARKPFISVVPRPKTRPPRIVAVNGGLVQSCPSVGTTSVWAESTTPPDFHGPGETKDGCLRSTLPGTQATANARKCDKSSSINPTMSKFDRELIVGKLTSFSKMPSVLYEACIVRYRGHIGSLITGQHVTYSIAARCSDTGAFGIAITSSSICVASRCAWVGPFGLIISQNVTDPALGPRAAAAAARARRRSNSPTFCSRAHLNPLGGRLASWTGMVAMPCILERTPWQILLSYAVMIASPLVTCSPPSRSRRSCSTLMAKPPVSPCPNGCCWDRSWTRRWW